MHTGGTAGSFVVVWVQGVYQHAHAKLFDVVLGGPCFLLAASRNCWSAECWRRCFWVLGCVCVCVLDPKALSLTPEIF